MTDTTPEPWWPPDTPTTPTPDEECAACGYRHDPAEQHPQLTANLDAHAAERDWATDPTDRLVIFHGVDDTGRALWVDP